MSCLSLMFQLARLVFLKESSCFAPSGLSSLLLLLLQLLDQFGCQIFRSKVLAGEVLLGQAQHLAYMEASFEPRVHFP